MRKLRNSLVALSLSVALAGCAMGPDYEALEIELADTWPEQLQQVQTEQGDWLEWWTQFNDPVLNQLVERALDDSLELQLQMQRIEQARAAQISGPP